MNIKDKIRLIDDLIKEFPDVTIRDYLDALKEIIAVEAAMKECSCRKD